MEKEVEQWDEGFAIPNTRRLIMAHISGTSMTTAFSTHQILLLEIPAHSKTPSAPTNSTTIAQLLDLHDHLIHHETLLLASLEIAAAYRYRRIYHTRLCDWRWMEHGYILRFPAFRPAARPHLAAWELPGQQAFASKRSCLPVHR